MTAIANISATVVQRGGSEHTLPTWHLPIVADCMTADSIKLAYRKSENTHIPHCDSLLAASNPGAGNSSKRLASWQPLGGTKRKNLDDKQNQSKDQTCPADKSAGVGAV